MLCARKTWWAVLALSLLAVSADPAGAAPAPTPGKGRIAPAERLIPADAEGVVVINWRQMVASPLFKKHGLKDLKKMLEQNEPARKMLQAMGLDPVRDIDSMMIAFSQTGGGDGKGLAIVRGNFDLDKIAKSVADFAEKRPGELKITREGGVRLYQVTIQGKPAYAAFADSTTLLITPSKEDTLASVRKVAAAPAPLNAKLKEALAKTNTKDAMWFAVVATDQMKKLLAGNPQTKDIAESLESVTGGISFGDNMTLTVKINCDAAAAATAVRKKLDAIKPFLALLAQSDEKVGPVIGELLSHLKIGTEKNTTKITLEITQEMLEKAAELEKKDK